MIFVSPKTQKHGVATKLDCTHCFDSLSSKSGDALAVERTMCKIKLFGVGALFGRLS